MSAAPARAGLTWALLVAETLLLGTSVFALFVAPATADQTRRTFARLWRGWALTTVVLSPLLLWEETADMAGVSLRDALAVVPQVIWESHVGTVWMWSVPITVGLVGAAWLPTSGTVRAAMLCLLAAGELLCGSLVSHAIDSGRWTVATYFVHEVAAAVWFGSLVGLWLGVRAGRLGPDWATRAAPRVSRVAGWAVAVLILTGLVLTAGMLGLDADRIFDTEYGRTLLIKVGAVALTTSIGAYNRYWLIPEAAQRGSPRLLMRNVGIESAMLVAILGLAALLANTPPGHHH